MAASCSAARNSRPPCSIGINLVTVLFNNSAYGNVLRDQHRLFEGRDSGSKLHNPDFATYAKSFGVPYWRATNADGLRTAVTEALAAHAPALWR